MAKGKKVSKSSPSKSTTKKADTTKKAGKSVKIPLSDTQSDERLIEGKTKPPDTTDSGE